MSSRHARTIAELLAQMMQMPLPFTKAISEADKKVGLKGAYKTLRLVKYINRKGRPLPDSMQSSWDAHPVVYSENPIQLSFIILHGLRRLMTCPLIGTEFN